MNYTKKLQNIVDTELKVNNISEVVKVRIFNRLKKEVIIILKGVSIDEKIKIDLEEWYVYSKSYVVSPQMTNVYKKVVDYVESNRIDIGIHHY